MVPLDSVRSLSSNGAHAADHTPRRGGQREAAQMLVTPGRRVRDRGVRPRCGNPAAHWTLPQLIPIASFHGRVARAHRESLLVVCENVRNPTNLPRARCSGEWLGRGRPLIVPPSGRLSVLAVFAIGVWSKKPGVQFALMRSLLLFLRFCRRKFVTSRVSVHYLMSPADRPSRPLPFCVCSLSDSTLNRCSLKYLEKPLG